MSIELLEMTVDEFLHFINKHPELGSITTIDIFEAENTFPDIRQDDVVVYYDYCTDDLDGPEESEFCDWLNNTLFTIDDFMKDRGYKEVAENDGSGGGLWYGAFVYRKI